MNKKLKIILILAILMSLASISVLIISNTDTSTYQEPGQNFILLDRLPKAAEADNYIILRHNYSEHYQPETSEPAMDNSGEYYSYIKKQKPSRTGIQSPAYGFDLPYTWTVGRVSWESCLHSYSEPDDSISVFGHVTESSFTKNQFSDNWQGFMKDLVDASLIYNPDNQITDLQFESYSIESGFDLYFYTYTYHGDNKDVEFAVAYILGEKYQAEFIGIKPSDSVSSLDIKDVTRYIAATYTEKDGRKTDFILKSEPYIGAADWPWESLHNPFAIARTLYTNPEPPKLEGEDYETAFKSAAFEAVVREFIIYHYDMTISEEAAFMARPLYASDLAWITQLTIKESPIPGRDTLKIGPYTYGSIEVPDLMLEGVEDLLYFTNLESLELKIGGMYNLEELTALLQLKDISITCEYDNYDFEWVRDMPQLEKFKYEVIAEEKVAHFSIAKEHSTFEIGKEEKLKENSFLDFSAFKYCQNLFYLEVEVSGIPDISFLDEMDNLYTFWLRGEEEYSPEAKARAQLFPDDSYPQIKCLIIDGEWLRNPG